MTKNKIFATLLLALFAMPAFAQMSYGGYPHSNNFKNDHAIAEIQLPYVSNQQCLAEDDLESMKGRPFRVGVSQNIHLTNKENGTWDTLANGDKIWRIQITSAEATFLYPVFDTYIIPEGAELFVYNPTKDFVLGKFTNQNADEGKFHTQVVPGESIIIEYFEPADAEFSGQLEISQIQRGHREIFTEMRNMTKGSLGDSEGSCHINVASSEGSSWQAQKNGVVCIGITTSEGTYLCSGSMINNTRRDGTKYLLTANHCQEDLTITRWTFYFLYEASTCSGTSGPINKSATGATIVANKATNNSGTGGSDFLLLKITGLINSAYNVYFNGWDRSTSATVGSCIHHPGGDLKKISIPASVSSGNTYFWVVSWKTGSNNKGVTEQGSSGSPLFNSNKRIIGQLWAGSSSCDAMNGNDYYGKISASWTGGGTSSTRLKDWLDPTNSGVTYLDGVYASAIGNNDITAAESSDNDIKVFPNPAKDVVNIALNETGVAEYTLCNEIGATIKTGRMFFGLDNYKFNVKDIKSGTYIITIDINGCRYTKTIIVTK